MHLTIKINLSYFSSLCSLSNKKDIKLKNLSILKEDLNNLEISLSKIDKEISSDKVSNKLIILSNYFSVYSSNCWSKFY